MALRMNWEEVRRLVEILERQREQASGEHKRVLQAVIDEKHALLQGIAKERGRRG